MRILLLAFAFAVSPSAGAQENLNYQKPSADILALADYERAPSVSMDSAKRWMLFSYTPTYKSLDDLSQPELRLAGLRINPRTNISSTVTYINRLTVRAVSGGEVRTVSGLPANPRISGLLWSPDERRVAFLNTVADGVEAWVLDVAEARATRLSGPVVNANMGQPLKWYQDSMALLMRRLPADRPGLLDPAKDLPAGPIVSSSDGKVSQNRTYQDLLKNPQDERNFETLARSELVKVGLDGAISVVRPADLYVSESFSPDGRFLMVTALQRPYSYLVPWNRFPMTSKVYDAKGSEVQTVNTLPLYETQPKGFMAVRPGRRSMAWRDDRPASLYFVEALDGGDPAVKVEFRDALYSWDAPFQQQPQRLLQLQQRFSDVMWGDADTAVVQDEWYDTRNIRTFLFAPGRVGGEMRKLYDRNAQDIYGDPGRFETERTPAGRRILAKRAGKLFLIGDGYGKEGQFPFIDALDTTDLSTSRLYRSAYTDRKEDLISIEDFDRLRVLVRIQSPSEYPNFYFRELTAKPALKQLTQFANPFESLKGVHKEVIEYTRADGVRLTGTLYLPKDYRKRAKHGGMPLLIWAYPAEYKDRNSAGQSTNNPNEFTFPSYGSFVYWVNKGYAVLDDAAFPIIGEGKTEPNDDFVPQLVANAKAAIDAVAGRGLIDRRRVAVGGHSYGAFMTANLLTHSDLFACGIARSGAYNRTLTPFGFQSEQRSYWEVPDVYTAMSPFMNAQKMKTPMLLVHGEADNNPGTFTLQTERYFQALKGLGAPVRMVILPKESHGYAARESILHLLWEQDVFLERCLKP
jgi:dipeptidyl aminopeptidase/acylaminoacyl peptidase